jgi:hypothetical protein
MHCIVLINTGKSELISYMYKQKCKFLLVTENIFANNKVYNQSYLRDIQ